MKASEQYVMGYKDGRDFRHYESQGNVQRAIERITNDLHHDGVEHSLRAYWIGYVAALERRPPLFTA
jgi:hypothetical protein